ncbi:MAG: helix-turn-helix domain-containing protein [Clostridia bacterium]|nr:helix-turn-helix domain-containing protein [Clostridia bacterium]
MNNIGVELGKEIRKRRNNLGISQDELAFKSGISAAHLGQIERALKNPTIETVSNIASALNISLSDLFSFESKLPASSDEQATDNKISAYLSSMSEEDKKDVLKIIKIIKKSHK